MSLKVKKKKGASLPPMEGGTYPAVCVGVVDLGEQYSEHFKKFNDKVLVIWEIPSQTIEVEGEQKPRWLSKDFSASLNEKSNLYKFLVPWRGKAFTEDELSDEGGFDLKEMLGVGCLLQVIIEDRDDGTKFNKITTVIGLPVGMPAPTTETEPIIFDMDAWDDAALQALPDWVQDRVRKSTQYKKLHTPNDEIGFNDEKKTVTPAEEMPKEDCPI